MEQNGWNDSLAFLLNSCGIVTEHLPKQARGQEGLSALVRGTEYEIKPIRKGSVRFGTTVVGAMLQRQDGRWLSVFKVPQREGWFWQEGKAPASPLKKEDLADVTGGWVLCHKDAGGNTFQALYRRYQNPLLQIIGCGLFINLFGLCLPIFGSFVYDKVLGNGITETLWALAIGLFIISIFDFALRAMRSLAAERFALASDADIDRSVMMGLLDLDHGRLPSVGLFLDRYKKLMGSRDFLSSSYLLSLVDIPFILVYLIAMGLIAGWLVFVPLTFGALMLLANYFTSVCVLDYDKQSRKEDGNRYGILVDVLSSHEYVIGSHLRRELAGRWRQACAQVSSMQGLSRYWKMLGAALSNNAAFLSYAGVIVGGAYMIEAQTLTSGGLIAVSMLSSRMMGCFSSVSVVFVRYKDFVSSLRDMKDMLASADEEQEKQMPHGALQGHLNLRNVTYRYVQGGNPVLSSISLSFKAGEMIGIAGPPGSGKTTLMRLMGGAVAPESGDILLDNYPLSGLGDQAIATSIGYKPQDLCLVSGTIEDNIRAGGASLTPEERESVLKASGLEWLFQHTGLHWASEVGSRGSALSGGQKQVIALARSLLRQPPVLLLDEPTNGLDAQLEAHLAKRLAAMKGKSTIIVSTHSRQLLSICDRIVVVGEGRILADGQRDKILVA